MVKKILIVGGGVAGVAVLGCAVLGWWAYLVFTGPLYEPGSLAGAPGLQPPAQFGDETTWLIQRGVRLHHFHRGQGRPILFVHGGPGFPIRQTMPWLDALDADYTVHYYDQRGCGLSSRPFDRFENPNDYANMKQLEATLGLGAQIADLERIRRLLGEERLILVGHSFGGFLAALYAAEFPQRVEKLVLLAPANMLVMPLPEGEDLFTNARDRLPPDRQVEFDGFLEEYLDFGALFDHDEDSLARMNLRLGNFLLEGMGHPALPVPEPGAAVENGGWMTQAMYLSMGRRHDYTGALAAITADTLVVHGDQDLQPVAGSRQYTQGIANAELFEVAGADHFLMGDHPDLARRVASFLQGTAG
ncbi:MAG: alpha/beta fold hydrolase [Planctomycetota bacterium]|jgi:proline iminopeptidase